MLFMVSYSDRFQMLLLGSQAMDSYGIRCFEAILVQELIDFSTTGGISVHGKWLQEWILQP